MADIAINDYIPGLTEATLDGTEDMIVVKDGVTKRCSTQDVADLAASGSVITVKVSVSSSEILALFATPKTLIAAPGAGKIINPIAQRMKFTYGTTTYSGGSMVTSLGGNAVFTQATYLSTALGFDYRTPASFSTGTDLANTALILSVASSNPTTGDGTCDFYITYSIITL